MGVPDRVWFGESGTQHPALGRTMVTIACFYCMTVYDLISVDVLCSLCGLIQWCNFIIDIDSEASLCKSTLF